MAIFEYTAKDESGNTFSGIYQDVASVAVLREELGMTGCRLVKARKAKNRSPRKKKIKRADVVAFTFKFAGMYKAGLSILRCLETIEEQCENKTFKKVLSQIRQDVETGSSLKAAFEKHRAIFTNFLIGMIEAGESGGKLSDALEMSATFLEKQLDLRRKVRSAFAYPLAVISLCSIVVTCVLIFIVPIFEKLYKALHVPLPLPTKILVDLSTLIRTGWWAIPFVIAGLYYLIRKILRDPTFKARWDVFKLQMPVFGKLNSMVLVSGFIRTYSMLASVGVSLIEALDSAKEVAHNRRLDQIAEELQNAIKTGGAVGDSLGNYKIFPPIIVQLAKSGEEAGVLPEMLGKGAEFLDKDIDRMVKSLLAKLEPAMTVMMGSVVGLLMMGVYLPMFDYMSHMK